LVYQKRSGSAEVGPRKRSVRLCVNFRVVNVAALQFKVKLHDSKIGLGLELPIVPYEL